VDANRLHILYASVNLTGDNVHAVLFFNILFDDLVPPHIQVSIQISGDKIRISHNGHINLCAKLRKFRNRSQQRKEMSSSKLICHRTAMICMGICNGAPHSTRTLETIFQPHLSADPHTTPRFRTKNATPTIDVYWINHNVPQMSCTASTSPVRTVVAAVYSKSGQLSQSSQIHGCTIQGQRETTLKSIELKKRIYSADPTVYDAKCTAKSIKHIYNISWKALTPLEPLCNDSPHTSYIFRYKDVYDSTRKYQHSSYSIYINAFSMLCSLTSSATMKVSIAAKLDSKSTLNHHAYIHAPRHSMELSNYTTATMLKVLKSESNNYKCTLLEYHPCDTPSKDLDYSEFPRCVKSGRNAAVPHITQTWSARHTDLQSTTTAQVAHLDIYGGSGAIGRVVYLFAPAFCRNTVHMTGRSGRTTQGDMSLQSHMLTSLTSINHSSTSDAFYLHSMRRKYVSRAIFATGSLRDAMIFNQTVKYMRLAMNSKTDAALLDASYNTNARSVILFSSISGLICTFGQVNYATANVSVDGHCVDAHRCGINKVSIQWGAWVDLPGMMKIDTIQANRLARTGINYVRTEFALYTLNLILNALEKTKTPVLAVNRFNWLLFKSECFVTPGNARRKRSKVLDARDMASAEAVVMEEVSRILGRQIHVDEPFIDAGLDSMCLTELSRSLDARFAISLPATVMFDYPTIQALTNCINRVLQTPLGYQSCGLVETDAKMYTDLGTLTISDASIRTGSCKSSECVQMEKFWTMIMYGCDAVRVVPLDRWDVDLCNSHGISQARDLICESYSRHGSFIRSLDVFDDTFFGSTICNHTLEPQQRELLKVCGELVQYNIQTEHFDSPEKPIALFVGICTNDSDVIFREAVANETVHSINHDEKKVSGIIQRMSESTYAFASNRVSYMLGLQGASMTTDCASASGLVSTHLAMIECKVQNVQFKHHGFQSIACSANIILHRQLADLHTARKMFPRDGRCKTFDEHADGFERGEGIGALIIQVHSSLKPIKTDHVWAKLMGSSCIHKGGGASLRALRGPAIEYKVKNALRDANIMPNDIAYIEASGLGEPLGDAIEAGAYQNVFFAQQLHRSLALCFGSVHTNVGHLDGASGMVSLLKSALGERNMMIAPLVHFTRLSSLMNGSCGAALAIEMGHTWRDVEICKLSCFPMIMRPNPSGVSGTSSFGYGGSMAHVITCCMATEQEFKMRTSRCLKEVAISRISINLPVIRPDINDYICNVDAFVRNLIWSELDILVDNFKYLKHAINITRDVNNSECNHTIISKFTACLYSKFNLDSSSTLSGNRASHLGSTIKLFANYIVRHVMYKSVSNSLSLGAKVQLWLDMQVNKYCALPISRTRPPISTRLKRNIIFLLASPRSGSTLLQMILNCHSLICAPQELYLLNFQTMRERTESMQRGHRWALEGLRKAIVDLKRCCADEADKILGQMETLSTQQVYNVLQEWCGSRILVDKSPPYVWSLDTMLRAEELFENAKYIYIYRHPWAAIESMTKQVLDVGHLSGSLHTCGKLWNVADACEAHDHDVLKRVHDHMENLWALGNANAMQFLESIDSSRALRLSYEELVSSPENQIKMVCDFMGLSYENRMLDPYSHSAKAFEPTIPGGLGAGDPHIMKHQKIDSDLAYGWKAVRHPTQLSTFAENVALKLQYSMPRWKISSSIFPEEIRRLNEHTNGPVIICMYDVDGSCETFENIVSEARVAAFSISSNLGKLSAFYSIHDVAVLYAHIIRKELGLDGSDDIILVTTGFGVQLALEVASIYQNARDLPHLEQASHQCKSTYTYPNTLALFSVFNREYELLISNPTFFQQHFVMFYVLCRMFHKRCLQVASDINSASYYSVCKSITRGSMSLSDTILKLKSCFEDQTQARRDLLDADTIHKCYYGILTSFMFRDLFSNYDAGNNSNIKDKVFCDRRNTSTGSAVCQTDKYLTDQYLENENVEETFDEIARTSIHSFMSFLENISQH